MSRIRIGLIRLYALVMVTALVVPVSAAPVGVGDWSRVRLYGHAYDINGFSSAEYAFIADHYSVFTIEKRHARNVYGAVSTEEASTATAATIVANNPAAQVG